MSDENIAKERPTPPPVPKVSRETGAVTISRPEDVGFIDGWHSSTNEWEGGLAAVNGFNDAMPEDERVKAVKAFNEKPSNRII